MSKLRFRHTLDERHLSAQAEVYARNWSFALHLKLTIKNILRMLDKINR